MEVTLQSDQFLLPLAVEQAEQVIGIQPQEQLEAMVALVEAVQDTVHQMDLELV